MSDQIFRSGQITKAGFSVFNPAYSAIASMKIVEFDAIGRMIVINMILNGYKLLSRRRRSTEERTRFTECADHKAAFRRFAGSINQAVIDLVYFRIFDQGNSGLSCQR